MEQQKTGKLNQLHRILPEGLVVDAAWLEARGYSSALRSRYVSHGWLEQVVRSLYRRPPGKLHAAHEDEVLRWQHVVISLQTLMDRPLIVGGRTALELQGYAHYLSSMGPREIHLYGDERPPGWLSKLDLESRFIFHNAKRLFREEPIARGLGALKRNLRTDRGVSADPVHGGLTQTPWGHWDWPLTLSTPERAILELLDELPKRETFHQADMLMEGLRNLSPRRLRKLLLDCRSVKVKRLLFWFAERHNHAWFKHLDQDGIDLGRGKRMLVRGGKLDSKYRITVPKELNGNR